MALSTQPYKGARDFYPEDKRVQKYLFDVMRRVVESFGYEEYDAPIIESIDLYLAKSSAEIVSEQTYNFNDRGNRHVTLRPEMTPSVSRMVAGRRQQLAYPLRWYSIPNLWRYERPQRGRLREHWQLNVDIFGVAGLEAEHEIILLADTLLKNYGAKPDMYAIRLNSRKLINDYLFNELKLEGTQTETLIRLIDRMHKLPPGEFTPLVDALLSPVQRENGVLQQIEAFLDCKRLEDLPESLQQHESVQKLKSLLELLGKSNVTSIGFDITLMRGFDYYTDIVFEIFDTKPSNNRSMFGGGRYDGLVGQFGVEPVPTVGFGMGDVTLQNFLEDHKLLPEQPPTTDVVVLLAGDVYTQAQPLLEELRREGIRTAVDSSGKKLEKQLKNTLKMGVRYVLFAGDKELHEGRYNLKNLVQNTEETHGLERIIAILAAQHPRSKDEE